MSDHPGFTMSNTRVTLHYDSVSLAATFVLNLNISPVYSQGVVKQVWQARWGY
jgi:hypothetical protein